MSDRSRSRPRSRSGPAGSTSERRRAASSSRRSPIDVPAAKVLDGGDVIVGVDATHGGDRRSAARPDEGAPAGRSASSCSCEAGQGRRAHGVGRWPRPGDPKRAIIGITVVAGREDQAAGTGRASTSGTSAARPQAFRSRSKVLQELGHDVDRGHRVAATGEIELDGRSGRSAGSSRRPRGQAAGVDVFLVPAGDNARRQPADMQAGLRVIPVESFQQALRVLRTLPPEIARLQVFCLEGRQPQIAGLSFVGGLAGVRRRGQNPRCSSGEFGVRRREGT